MVICDRGKFDEIKYFTKIMYNLVLIVSTGSSKYECVVRMIIC